MLSTYNTTLAGASRVPKISSISGSSEYSRHGRDIETEESTANGGEATDGVHIVEGLHTAKQWNRLCGKDGDLMRLLKLGLSDAL